VGAIQEFLSDCSKSWGDKKHTAQKLSEQMIASSNQPNSIGGMLPQCFGNRSAVLFELERYKVRSKQANSK